MVSGLAAFSEFWGFGGASARSNTFLVQFSAPILAARGENVFDPNFFSRAFHDIRA